MILKDIQISFVGMEPTTALKKYVVEKITKHKHLWKDATGMDIFLKENTKRRGVKDDFRVDITVALPNSSVRVEVSGENMYANIDEASDTLARRLKRYLDKKTYWDGVTPWRVLESDANLMDIGDDQVDNYENYVPKISVRKNIEDMSPLEEGEAIERMELLGYEQYLFRNKNTGKISMIYKMVQGDYGLVEPANSEI